MTREGEELLTGPASDMDKWKQTFPGRDCHHHEALCWASDDKFIATEIDEASVLHPGPGPGLQVYWSPVL